MQYFCTLLISKVPLVLPFGVYSICNYSICNIFNLQMVVDDDARLVC